MADPDHTHAHSLVVGFLPASLVAITGTDADAMVASLVITSHLIDRNIPTRCAYALN